MLTAHTRREPPAALIASRSRSLIGGDPDGAAVLHPPRHLARRRARHIDRTTDETLVFSNETGEPLTHLHDAWAALRPERSRHQAAMDGTTEAQGPLERIEGRLLQSTCAGTTCGTSTPRAWSSAGVPLAQVRDLLGHASITTTERYDNQGLEKLQIAAAKLESGSTR